MVCLSCQSSLAWFVTSCTLGCRRLDVRVCFATGFFSQRHCVEREMDLSIHPHIDFFFSFNNRFPVNQGEINMLTGPRFLATSAIL